MSSNLERKRFYYLVAIFFIILIGILFIPSKKVMADDEVIYSDGIYRYRIINETNKEVMLIGVETTEEMEELSIPGKITLHEMEYTVASVDFQWDYYHNETYANFYNSVKRFNIEETFTGTLANPLYAFPNLNSIKFHGSSVPKEVNVSISNRSFRDFLFIVPKGMEAAYSKVIRLTLFYSMVSDLYEDEMELTPTIVSKEDNLTEYGIFAQDGFIYKVMASGKEGVGKVELLGITHYLKRTYINLPEKVKNKGYTYQLTKLGRFSMIGSGARVVVVPDSVTEMENAVFDKDVELLFLSKNCKVIPRLITDENNESNLIFAYVPEGVTTISIGAFDNLNKNTASIILPSTITEVGKKSLYGFKLVTFLNKKPLEGVKAAVKAGTTVKVPEAAVTTFKKSLGNKYNVVAAKNIVKTKDITVNKESLKINMLQMPQISASLTKGSNETIYWLSSDPNILEVSSKGIITSKKAGTAYVVAYTRTSGRHKAIKVTVTDFTFTEGIYTYRVTNPSKKTVTLCEVRPDNTLTALNIPETIKYKNVEYTITGVIANPDDTSVPLIPKDYSQNVITEITFPKTITEKMGYLGELKKIKRITFLGKTAPSEIIDWYKDDGLLAFQAVIYVPVGSINSYTSALYVRYGYNTHQSIHYGCRMDFNIVESGNDQVQRFVVDGILYRVTKYAGKGNGTVAVKGVDVELDKVVIPGTVTYNGHTYNVTEIYKGVLDSISDKEKSIDESIKKRSTEEKYSAPITYVLD